MLFDEKRSFQEFLGNVYTNILNLQIQNTVNIHRVKRFIRRHEDRAVHKQVNLWNSNLL